MGRDAEPVLIRLLDMIKKIPREPSAISSRDMHNALVASGYQVTKRTVERDFKTILNAGFPVIVDTTESPYLWSWSKVARDFHVPSMNASDALLFYIADSLIKSTFPPSVIKVLEEFSSQAQNILDAVSGSNQLSSWRDKVRVAIPVQPLIPPEVDSTVRDIVYDCLLRDMTVQIAYQARGKDVSSDYVVMPLGLVQRGWIKYLICTFAGYNDIRQLALHRIKKAESRHEVFVRPVDFDLDDYVEKGFTDFGDGSFVKFIADVSNDVACHLSECRLSDDQVLEPSPVGHHWKRVQATVALTPALLWWARGFGQHLKIVSPDLEDIFS